MIVIMVMTMTNELIKFEVRTKRCRTIIQILGNNLEVMLCENRERCVSMGITNCPPFCDKISALKLYLRTGKSKNGYKIVKID